MGKPEGYVEKYLYAQVKVRGGMCIKFLSSINGIPDRVVILAGRTVFVETKAPGGQPRRLQLVRHAEMRAAGGDVRVIDTREEVDELIGELVDGTAPSASLASTPEAA